ncbi:hypothetical protein AB0A69_15725 [Streptomyces sp. NPDC045431]|uniref:hypothetical protein n=1 Tax=Streptomyces sp. NPDC045431 TaxID=3155613 RepID=UPI003406D7AB
MIGKDRRRVIAELTAEGRATWRGAMDAVGHEEYRLLGVLSESERGSLNDMLRRIMLLAERPHPRKDEGAAREPEAPRALTP